MNILKTTSAAAVAAVVMAGGASAASITVAGGGATDSCSLSNFTVSIACDGDFAVANPGGNVAGSDLDPLFFADGSAITGWTEIDAIESVDSSGEQSGDNNLFKINTSDTNKGTWALVDPFAFSADKYYVFALKGATDQVAYFMDIQSALGNWTNGDLETPGGPPARAGNGKGPPGGNINLAGLSNIRLFETQGDPVGVVPLPAAGWLLFVGLGGLAAFKRRKKV